MDASKASQDDADPDPDPGFGPGPDVDATNDHNEFYHYHNDSPSGSSAEHNLISSELLSPAAAEAHAEAVIKERNRVRFNSNGDVNRPPSPPPATHLPGMSTPEHREALKRPSILRANSSGSVMTTKDFSDGEDLLEGHRSIRLQTLKLGEGSNQSQPSEDETDDGNDNLDQEFHDEAYNLVRSHTRRFGPSTEAPNPLSGNFEAPSRHRPDIPPSESNDGMLIYDGVYNVPAPEEYRGSVLSHLLKLYKPSEMGASSSSSAGDRGHTRNNSSLSTAGTPGSDSGTTTPNRRKWYEQNRSQETLASLIDASARLANPNMDEIEDKNRKSKGKKRKKPGKQHKRKGSGSRLSGNWQKEEARITVHIAETLSRQGYIIKLCRALMLFGAPTHRLEEYLSMTARVLEIDGQFLYLPGCMVVSFDDKSTHTTEVRIVRTTQGIDLGRLKDVHHVYKEVMHDIIGVEDATHKLDTLISAREKFGPWTRVFIFGLTSATCAPFSFKARLIDLPLCFVFGCLVGLLQLIVASKSNLYSNVFEVSATVAVSFLARAFGSLKGGNLFCFSALAQGGIVMLLPGYSVLCSALELQSRAMVPGSIRIVYAIIYSLLLGFGITVGAALWGLFDNDATSDTTCQNPPDSYYGFIFVPFFVVCISMLYQAKWQQMPVMVTIAFAGYVVNFFSSIRFAASPQIASTLGALTVGVLANLYSRIRHGVAAATLIPAIFTQVPGGLASTGGLLSGLTTANQLTNSSTAVNGTDTSVDVQQGDSLNSVVFQVAASMIQIAIGIAVGLFLSALIIYPLGKRRSGLFSF